jgi:serine/threonine-protein kinase
VIPAALLTVALIAAAGITGYLLRPQHAAPPVQTPLPFTGLFADSSVAVDSAGNLYVADPFNNRVLKLAPASNTPTVVPFTGIIQPRAVAVDGAGNLYVTDPGKSRVAKLPVG